MKLLLVSQHYSPEIGAASNRMENLIKRLVNFKYEMYVITSKPWYPNPKLYADSKVRVVETRQSLIIYRIPKIASVGIPLFNRLLNTLWFSVAALFVAIWVLYKYRINTVLTTSPPMFVNGVGWIAARVMRRKWIMEVRDLWPDSMLANNLTTKRSLLYRVLKKIEHACYKSAQQIIVVTPGTKQLLIEAGVPQDKVWIVSNGIPDWTLEVEVLPHHSAQTNKLSLVYIGNIGLSQGLDRLIHAAAEIEKSCPNLEFFLVGDGLEKPRLIELSKRLQLKNIQFISATRNRK